MATVKADYKATKPQSCESAEYRLGVLSRTLNGNVQLSVECRKNQKDKEEWKVRKWPKLGSTPCRAFCS